MLNKILVLTTAVLMLLAFVKAQDVDKEDRIYVELPIGFRGPVLIEYPVPDCPYPEEKGGIRTIRVLPFDGGGRGCSRLPEHGGRDWRFIYSGKPENPLPDAPLEPIHIAKKMVDPSKVFLWWEVSGTCPDLQRQTVYVIVGTSRDYENSPAYPGQCEPTPWP